MPSKTMFLRAATGSVTALLLSSCAAPQYPVVPTSYSNASYFNTDPVAHTYTLRVVDAAGLPVQKASVEWDATVDRKTTSITKTTDDNGISTIVVTVVPKLNASSQRADYGSAVHYAVKKADYFVKTGSLNESGYHSPSENREAVPQKATVVVLRPADYLRGEFASAPQYEKLREKVLDSLTAIRGEIAMNQSDLKLHGISMQEFKGKRYLTLELTSDNVFNSLKLNRYAIAKQIFDETVRKTLNPLNQNISDQKLFYGYDIIVDTRDKSFADESAIDHRLRYEFMMPQLAVRNYKDKNISGQKLIDESVVLLNDERIDLIFQ